MNWIKQNTFLFGLAVVTVVGVIALWLVGNMAAGRYDKAQEKYQAALDEGTRFVKIDPYPNKDLYEEKKIAVQEYNEETGELQEDFSPYRKVNLENITVQDFSSKIRDANRMTREAFGPDAEVPEPYFCGFEAYRNALPPGNATGILNYQLGVTEKIMLNLANAGISELISVRRPKLAEEEGKSYEPTKKQVFRELPLEMVFKCRESAARQFLSTLPDDNEDYLVVRSIKIRNENDDPPRKDDARFEGVRSRAADLIPPPPAQLTSAPDPFESAGFDPADAFNPEGDAVAPRPAQPGANPSLAGIDTSQILSQVMGEEEVYVFVRLDILVFLEPKQLP